MYVCTHPNSERRRVQKQAALKPAVLHISQVCLLHTAWSVPRVVQDGQVWQLLLDLIVQLVSKCFCATEGYTVLARLQALDELMYKLILVIKPIGLASDFESEKRRETIFNNVCRIESQVKVTKSQAPCTVALRKRLGYSS